MSNGKKNKWKKIVVILLIIGLLMSSILPAMIAIFSAVGQ